MVDTLKEGRARASRIVDEILDALRLGQQPPTERIADEIGSLSPGDLDAFAMGAINEIASARVRISELEAELESSRSSGPAGP
jgi:hypothetical protein